MGPSSSGSHQFMMATPCPVGAPEVNQRWPGVGAGAPLSLPGFREKAVKNFCGRYLMLSLRPSSRPCGRGVVEAGKHSRSRPRRQRRRSRAAPARSPRPSCSKKTGRRLSDARGSALPSRIQPVLSADTTTVRRRAPTIGWRCGARSPILVISGISRLRWLLHGAAPAAPR